MLLRPHRKRGELLYRRCTGTVAMELCAFWQAVWFACGLQMDFWWPVNISLRIGTVSLMHRTV